jgi:hypothetical protein
MNDAQIIAISITVLAVLAGSVFNNVRIGDVSISLNRRIDDMKEVLRTEMDLRFERIDIRFERIDQRFERMDSAMNQRFERMDSAMNQRFERMDSKLDTIITMLGQLDTRVTKLEGRSS